MKRIVLATVMLLATWSTSTAEQAAYDRNLTFAAFRNGERIGTHQLEFRHEGNQLVVSTSIDLAVKMMGFTAYKYSHRSQEVWSGDNLLAITSSTDDDGKQYSVKAARQGNSLVIDRTAPGAAAGQRETLPPGVLPSSHWNMRQTMQSQLLNSQKGTVDPIRVTPVGRETVTTASGSVEATRYRYEGGVKMDQWFDARGRWVKTTFKASDGSQIEYVLQ